MTSTTDRASDLLQELDLRRNVRSSLEVWSRFALLESGQAPARHHLEIIAALEKISSGVIDRLILLLPPGSAKSTYASRLFPAYWLAQHPTSAIIAASHTARLAHDFGRGVRRLVETHSLRLGLRIRGDARAAGRFITHRGGEYFAIGVHGAVTGRRADLALVDDPVRSFADAESFKSREHLWEWFRAELVTRLKPGGRMVLIMTRWHCDDLAGRLIEQGGWEVLRLPALAEDGDMLGRAIGEALWPEWENTEALLQKRGLLGDRHFAALFQQSPMGEGGVIFDVRKLRIVNEVPDGISVRAWDLAATADGGSDPDWTVGLKMVREVSGGIFVDDVIRFRGAPGDVSERIRAAAKMDGTAVTIGLPQDPGQAGKAQITFLTQVLAGYRVVSTPETGLKTTRAMPIASQVSGGTVAVRRADWNGAFMSELANFPHGGKDDQVDALSRAFALLISNSPAARFTALPFSLR